MLLKQLILKTLTLVLITSAFCFVVFRLFFPEKLLLVYLLLPLFFGVINCLIFYALFKEQDSPILKFSNRYLLCTTVKLLISIFLIVLFLLFNKEKAIPFLSTFLVIYIVFLIQEIITILKFFKKKEKSETTHAKT
jgi:hypothetical protein